MYTTPKPPVNLYKTITIIRYDPNTIAWFIYNGIPFNISLKAANRISSLNILRKGIRQKFILSASPITDSKKLLRLTSNDLCDLYDYIDYVLCGEVIVLCKEGILKCFNQVPQVIYFKEIMNYV